MVPYEKVEYKHDICTGKNSSGVCVNLLDGVEGVAAQVGLGLLLLGSGRLQLGTDRRAVSVNGGTP